MHQALCNLPLLHRLEHCGTGKRDDDNPMAEFNEKDWYSLVEYATVYNRDDIRFTFKNGMEIKA